MKLLAISSIPLIIPLLVPKWRPITGQYWLGSINCKYCWKFSLLEGIRNYYIRFLIKQTRCNGPYSKLTGRNNSLFDSWTTRVFSFWFLKSVPGIEIFKGIIMKISKMVKSLKVSERCVTQKLIIIIILIVN